LIERSIASKALSLATQFPIVSITGPRQSGKTTLVKALFPLYSYVSLEDPDMRAFASDDPRAFLIRFGRHTVIDEAQRVPQLFSFLQGVVDETGEPGQFVITGSQNFLLMEAIDQSLSGRVAILNLLPFSANELANAGMLPATLNEWLYTGAYPRIYDYRIDPADYYPSYIQTYLERDVRTTTGVTKLAEFERLLGLCAARNSEMLNIQALSRDCGVAINTVKEWLSVLESSLLIHRLQPYYRNLGKRITKTPKLYLRDTGLASNLIGLEKPDDIDLSPSRGGLFETAVIEEIAKTYYARGRVPKLFYWRDAAKREIDVLIERGTKLCWAIEVKSSTTYTPKFFKHLDSVAEELGVGRERRVVVYGGEESFETSHGLVCALADLAALEL
jgi:predicted AAA+ superfamily ATPase